MGQDDFREDQEYKDSNCGLMTSDDLRVGYINGATFRNKPVTYSVVRDLAVFEGCIVLGTAEQLAATSDLVQADADGEIQHGVVVSDEGKRWPGGLMPYEIDPTLPNQARVNGAVAHWEQNTNMAFVERTAANAAQYPNYVRFIPDPDGCWSYVGMQGGKQNIGLTGGCSTGSTIHEIGHAWGLWHEQSREDRDGFITVNWANITSGKEHNFNQHISDGTDIDAYNYGSIMHYGSMAFSKNGQPTIVPKQAGATIGQRSTLSQGDIDTVHAIYKTWWRQKRVYQTYASHDRENAWASVEDLGWRKIEKKSRDGVTNMFIALTEASANNLRVDVYADGDQIEILYV